MSRILDVATISQVEVVETLRNVVLTNISAEVFNDGAYELASELTGLSVDTLCDYVEGYWDESEVIQMARWKYTCDEFKRIRELINSDEDNTMEIMTGVAEICKKYAEIEDFDFATDFFDLEIEIECAIDDGDIYEYDADYYLGEFYDLCDYARIWLGL